MPKIEVHIKESNYSESDSLIGSTLSTTPRKSECRSPKSPLRKSPYHHSPNASSPSKSMLKKFAETPRWLFHPSNTPSANSDPHVLIPDLKGKVYIITGGNTGVGYETSLQLCKSNAKVYIACKNERSGQSAIKKIITQIPYANLNFLLLDLSSLVKVEEAAKRLSILEPKIDGVVNAEEVMATPFSLSADGIESQMAINHIGHHLFTTKLLPCLERSRDPRVVILSSSAHTEVTHLKIDSRRDELDSWQRYEHSKLANILFARQLQLKNPNLTVTAVHPGILSTTLTGKTKSLAHTVLSAGLTFVAIPPDQAASSVLYPLVTPNKGTVKNKYLTPFHNIGDTSDLAKDDKLARKLWDDTEMLIKKSIVSYN